eukprot:TRINITY_DN23827_c0_g1_i1.p1 TRINITY_DN23827_c0_g1~~TRINITY_DN23827_c0_g1_i1.p1  ORF type:complete len:230 (+),score=39.14 TRINITY_DN23827_c0_g1_i1:66-755(+)
MKGFALLALFIAVASAHMCLFQPPMRAVPIGNGMSDDPIGNEGVLSPEEYNNMALGAIDKCRRNINISPYENMASANNGSVCGGSPLHQDNIGNAWNTPGAATTIVPGQDLTIQWLQNAAHPAPGATPNDSGNRQTHHRIDFARTSTPTQNSDFELIGYVAGTINSNEQLSFTWSVPSDLSLPDGGVLRVIYFSGANGPNVIPSGNLQADPTLAGVSNTYTSCADIITA